MKSKIAESQMALFGEEDCILISPAVPVQVSVKTPVAQFLEQNVLVEIKKEKPARSFFTLQDCHLDKLAGDGSKIAANLAAIEVANRCSLEVRQATDEEKALLAAYTGWGGLSNVFAKNTAFPQQQEQLRQLLGEQGYGKAMESVLTAYYTEPEAIRTIWSLLQTMGFAGGSVLEPSCGTGNFIGAMPVELRQASKVSMVEIDPTTAKIASLLYADQETFVFDSGLQNAPIRSESFDLVVGNVPFGNYRVSDKRFDHLRLAIHDYFFAKCLDAVRPGGIVCLITSTWTMDKEGARLRSYLAERANLVAAIRLPSGAFKRLGGTDVVTDVVVLQKMEFGGKSKTHFGGVAEVPSYMMGPGYISGKINQYFVQNPNKVLGKIVRVKGRFGESLGVQAHHDWKERFQALSQEHDLRGLFDGTCNVSHQQGQRRKTDPKGVKGGNAFGYFFGEDGRLMLLDEADQVHSQSHLPAASRQRIEGMVRIRDCALELLEADAMQSHQAAHKRAQLNHLYDEFTRYHGFLMGNHNRRLFSADSHAPLLWSLEVWDDENEAAVKADVFTRPTVARAVLADTAQTVAQAMALSFNRFAKFNLAFVAKALGRDEDDVLEELQRDDRVFQDPCSLEWVDSDTYLSGDIYEKLDFARAAAQGDPRFDRNVSALQAIVPPPVALREVSVKLGASWISSVLIERFVVALTGVPRSDVQITHLPSTATWSVDGWLKNHQSTNQKWGTGRRKFAAILSDLLNQKSCEVHDRVVTSDSKVKMVLNQEETIAAREMADKIQTAFEQWIFEDKDRVWQLQDTYNRVFNGSVNRRYDGSHLVIPGLNPAIELRPAQKDAIWRGLVGGNTLFAQAVGGGKTLVQICLAQEMKRLGIANKPALVVPNHMLEAFASEYLRAFPRAKVLAAAKEDLVGDRRRTLLMRAAMHDWDCIIITHSSFGRLAVSQDAAQQFIDDIASKVEKSVMGATDQNAVRDAMRQRKQIEAKLKSLGSDEGKDNGVLPFEKLGIDFLCVDEADLFKNLWFHTKKTRVSGLSNTCSSRALDLSLKSQLIFRARGDDGFGLCFATATPIANTIAEMFIMQSYLHPWALEKKGLDSFDAWAANFAREVTAIEVKPEGSGYRMHTRFARFVNVPELMLLFREIAEIRTKKDLALPEPELAGGKHTVVSVPASESQKRYVQSLVERAEVIREGLVKPSEDNMLCVTNDGRKAALDMRCINPLEPDYEGSKVNACVQRVLHHWREGQQEKLTQLVFSDLSVPSAPFSVYRDMRDKLMAAGVPAEDIAFAQDFSTDKAKAELHRKVRQGSIRILFGSTELMGFGTNVQDRLIAKHDLDAPWRPRDVEQRDGRIIRQKNRNAIVHIYRYVTEQTFDAYMWQTLERKAGFIAQVMQHTGEARSLEDVTTQALSFAEVKALASGNPMVIEKAGVDAEVARLLALKSVHASNCLRMNKELRYAEEGAVYQRKLADNLQADLANLGHAGVVEFYGSTITDALEAGKAVMKGMAMASANAKSGAVRKVELCKIGNAQVIFEDYGNKRLFARISEMAYEIRLPYGAENIATALREKDLEKQLIAQRESALQRETELQQLARVTSEELQKEFEHENSLQAALERQAEIDACLEIDMSADGVVALEAEEA